MHHVQNNSRLLKACLLLVLCLSYTNTRAQIFADTLRLNPTVDSSLPPVVGVCGLTPNFILSLLDTGSMGGGGGGGIPSMIPVYASNAIDTCGKFAVYYDDIDSSTNIGFDDPTIVGGITLGQVRRNTYCEVLSYVQSLFDFSKVSYSDLIKIHVTASYGNITGRHAPPGYGEFAAAGPIFNGAPNTISGGLVNDYVTTGTDLATGYHGTLIVNFDAIDGLGIVYYQEDTATAYGGCNIDLFTALLHETGHMLGWLSLVKFPTGFGANFLQPYPAYSGLNFFSKIDTSMEVGSVFPTVSLHQLVKVIGGIPTLDTTLACNSNYWMNRLYAPDNLPVLAGDYLNNDLVTEYTSHLDDNQLIYVNRQHICPGDRQEYVMGPSFHKGVRRRQYTKGELETFVNVLGYKYIAADSNKKIHNHSPFSKKMAGYGMFFGNLAFPETVAADTTITNNGTPLTINLSSLVSKGDLYDADGDVISVDPGTLVNFRGCSDSGGNDHNRIALSGGNTVITYTPRHDFYGRAQFGFSLSDNKTDGSFYIYTIDVKQGTYPAYSVGQNMVVNPGFESGTEMKVAGDEGHQYSVTEEDNNHEGKWYGQSWSDSHPYDIAAHTSTPYGSGISVENSRIECWASASGQTLGTAGTSFPNMAVPLNNFGPGSRYQIFDFYARFSYYLLSDSLQQCHRYNLQFDVYTLNPIMQDIPIAVGFKDDASDYLAPVYNDTFFYNMPAVSPAAWKHITIPFNYCGNPSHILFLQDAGAGFVIDNLFLKEDMSAPPPLTVTITENPISTCKTELISHVSNAFCSLSYLWTLTAGTVLTAAKDTVFSNFVHTYTVTVSDGCRSAKAVDSITFRTLGPILGPDTVCTGLPLAFSDAASGGTWTSSNTSIAKIDLGSGLVTGISAGTVTITYTYFCLTKVTRVIRIVTSPSVMASNGGPVCGGVSLELIGKVVSGLTPFTYYWTGPGGYSSSLVSSVTSETTTVTSSALGTYSLVATDNSTCPSFAAVTVATVVPGIIGPTSACGGLSIPLSDSAAGGKWFVADTTMVKIDSNTGVVTTISAGATIITYQMSTGCYATMVLTVYITPTPIIGSKYLCVGASEALSDPVSGAFVWVSSAPVAKITAFSGYLTGVSAGTTVISYLSPYYCMVTDTITVVSPITPSPILGALSICSAIPSALSDTVAGGTWTSSNTGVATIDSSTGICTGLAAGTSTITYSTACGGSITATVTVNVSPPPIAGASSVCVGSALTLSDGLTGGKWTSSSTTVATVGSVSGIVTGHVAGTATIIYSLGAGCTATKTITVNPAPGAITGVISVCMGTSSVLSDLTAGGTWSSSNTAIATVSIASGLVVPVSAGVVTITYKLPAGCFSIATFTVHAIPTAISGSTACVGLSTAFSDGVGGGTWTSSNTTIATIGLTTGIATGVATGAATITYTLTGGCTTTKTITVSSVPVAITGPNAVCDSAHDTLICTPAGGTWTSSNTAIATIGIASGIVTGVSHGTATITYSLPTGCYSTFLITSFANDSLCSPCTSFGDFTIIGTSGSISANLPAGNYYIPNDVTIYGNDTFTHAIIKIAAGKTVSVDTSAFLVLSGSHMFGCDMWDGMVLKYGTTTSARLSVVGGSLIEDAMTAVSIMNPVTPSSGNIFTSDNAIFNRNYFGVDIENYTPTLSTYPFVIKNTVFCSRYFQGSFPAYPLIWPATSGPFGLKTPYTPSDLFQPPFNIDNPNPSGAASGVPYAPAPCWNGNMPYCGIYLSNIGATTLTGAIGGSGYIPATYLEIVIGDGTGTDDNPNQNLFDRMLVGISANTANVTAINNTFINMITDPRYYAWPSIAPPSGDGVYANSIDDVLHQKRLRVYTPPGSTFKNWFYKFLNGVESYNYYQLVGQNTYMINKPVAGSIYSPASPSGQYGYRVGATHYDTVDISNNTIYNVNTGIGMWVSTNYYYGNVIPFGLNIDEFTGECQILNNTIQASPYGYNPAMAEAVQTGIAVQNVLSTPSGCVWALSTSYLNSLNVDGNHINDAYNGIYLNNSFVQPATSNSNTIYVRPRISNLLQYGINHTLCNGSTMYGNFVTPSVFSTAGDNMRAYYAASNTAINIWCNGETYTGRGYEFFLGNPGSTWNTNTMTGNMKGFVLNGALVGPISNLGGPINDGWGGSWPVSTTAQTYVYNGADANLNPLYVSTFGGPTNNQGPDHFKNYDPSLGNIVVVAGAGATCPPPPPGPPREGVSLFEAMVRQDIVYANNPIPRSWMGQFELWKAMLVDTTLQDSSTVLHVFDSIAAGSRYAYITDIQTQFALGNYDSITTMLGYNIDSMANIDTDATTGVRMADNIDADNIVLNYQNFFGLYLKYLDTALSGTDSLGIMALAQLCPERNGTVVFQARSLYSFIYNDLSVFNDDSCMAVDTTYIADKHSNPKGDSSLSQSDGEQQYKLYPNPSHGTVFLLQTVFDLMPVNAEIWNAVGISVYKGELLFNGGTDQIRLANVSPGLYLLKLTDSKGRKFIFKFVEE